jgi:hypothetical protein
VGGKNSNQISPPPISPTMSFSGGNYSYQSGGSSLDNSNDFNKHTQTVGQNVTKIQQNSQKIKAMSIRINAAQDSGKLGEEQLQLIHYTKVNSTIRWMILTLLIM